MNSKLHEGIIFRLIAAFSVLVVGLFIFFYVKENRYSVELDKILADICPKELENFSRYESLDDLMEKARTFKNELRPTDAIATYCKMLGIDNKLTPIMNNIGVLLVNTNQNKPALNIIEFADKVKTDSLIKKNMGIILGKLDRPEEASRAYTSAIGLGDHSADILDAIRYTLLLAVGMRQMKIIKKRSG